MKSTDYILIQPTMVKDLLLSGNRLIIYALIHGFCKDGEHKFTGSINYISEWTNLSRNTVISVLKSLVDDGLITKSESIINNIKFCSYSVGSAKTSPVVQKTNTNAFSGSEEIAPKKDNNINNIGSSNNIKEEEKELKEKFASFVKKYKKAGGRVRGVDTEFNDFTKRHKDWKEIVPYLDIALEKEIKERESARIGRKFYPEMKNLQTYLGKQRAWEVYVTIGEDLSNEYMPQGHNVYYDELRGFYYYTGFYMRSNDIMDGYTDEERPDGAKLCLNNARGVIQWSTDKKEWRKL